MWELPTLYTNILPCFGQNFLSIEDLVSIQSIIENKGLKIPAKNGGKYPIDELFSKYDFTLTDLHVGIDFLRREES